MNSPTTGLAARRSRRPPRMATSPFTGWGAGPLVQCPRCRAENREGRRFCGECGLSFASTCPACGFLNEGSEKLVMAAALYREMEMRAWQDHADAEIRALASA